MAKFRCPGNEVDGPCGTIVEGKRREHPDSEIVKLEGHIRQGTLVKCRRLWVFYDECYVVDSYNIGMDLDQQKQNAKKLYPNHDMEAALFNYRAGEDRLDEKGKMR